ncbi:ATPase PAAT [Ambystoma mexicanum]|uniref:ATPase PAAT n=1 Tax=Ambystoma mexicanum TaxID=8296 RepID=UPI0037E9C4B5
MPDRVSVRCGPPWVCGAGLSSVVHVQRGTQEEEAREGDDLVLLERSSAAEDDRSCCLYIQCDPHSGEEILSLGLESQARTIEVYTGEEYLGTCRGEQVCTMPSNSSDEVVTLHKTFLRMESPVPACTVKLLSLGGRACVFVRGVSVGVAAARPRRPRGFPAAGIDLDSVQSMLEGSPLSSGAQQLMRMVQLQEKNHFPFGDQVQHFLRKADLSVSGGGHQADGLRNASDLGPALLPFSCISGVAGSNPARDYGTGDGAQSCGARKALDSRDDLKAMVSSFLQTSGAKDTSTGSPSLLPFLHSLCGEVKNLRIGDQDQQPQRGQYGESNVPIQLDHPGTCSYLEEVLSRQMGAMEKRLLDHIDNRMNRMQELMDSRMMLLADLLRSSNLTSGERLTNGDIHIFNDL